MKQDEIDKIKADAKDGKIRLNTPETPKKDLSETIYIANNTDI